MKKLFTTYLFFLSIGVFAFNTSKKVTETNTGRIGAATYLYSSPTTTLDNSTYKEFEKAAKKSGIPHRKLTNLKGVKNGYYVISGVYGSTLNAKKSVKKLRGKGFAANYIQLAETGMNYVYLKYFEKGSQAVLACATRFNNLYKDEVWIMAAQYKRLNTLGSSSLAKTNQRARQQGASSKKPIFKSNAETFEKAAAKNKIIYRTVSNLTTASNGYYVISGVYGSEFNAKKFVKTLRDKGFGADYIQMAETGMNYVYLKYFEKGTEAVAACATRFNNMYKDKVWILAAQKPRGHKLDSSSPVKTSQRARQLGAPSTKPTFRNNEETFEEAADKNNITYRTFSNMVTTPNGYYIISGTFSSDKNRDKAVKKLKRKGFDPGSVKNAQNGLNYVYLQYF
ncbi:MAG: SPOR domain-containing protein, partial [Aurantibacter sp.]